MGNQVIVLVAWFPSGAALSQVGTHPDMTSDDIKQPKNKQSTMNKQCLEPTPSIDDRQEQVTEYQRLRLNGDNNLTLSMKKIHTETQGPRFLDSGESDKVLLIIYIFSWMGRY